MNHKDSRETYDNIYVGITRKKHIGIRAKEITMVMQNRKKIFYKGLMCDNQQRKKKKRGKRN